MLMQLRDGQNAVHIFTSVWRKNKYFISTKQAKREKKISVYFVLLLWGHTKSSSQTCLLSSVCSAHMEHKYLTHMNQGSRFLCHRDVHDLTLNISNVKCIILIDGIVLRSGDNTIQYNTMFFGWTWPGQVPPKSFFTRVCPVAIAPSGFSGCFLTNIEN